MVKNIVVFMFLFLFGLSNLFCTPIVSASDGNITTVSTPESSHVSSVTTVYELIPVFITQSSNANISNKASSYGSATVTCRDGGHGVAVCNTKYTLVNDVISSISTTVYIYKPGGIYVDSERETLFTGGHIVKWKCMWDQVLIIPNYGGLCMD